MKTNIAITGAGIVSALGVGKQQTLEALLQKRSGVGEMRYLKSEHKEFPVGEVPMRDSEMVARLGLDPARPTTRTSLMGMLALGEALQQARLENLEKVGFVSGTTVGGMDKSEQFYLDFLENNQRNEYIATHDCGACTEMIADHFGRFAFVSTLSTACSSAANAIILGAEKICNGEVDIVVVGGSECLTKFHLNGFNSLMILDKEGCRPFDATRAGLNLGEGAAYIVLETQQSAMKRGVEPLAYLSGYGNACDAFHQTASSPNGEGAYRAMREALRKGGVAPEKVDYINAHGTGTQNNDESECEAMRRLFGEQLPPFSSTKSYTGHTTSASGSIEAVICLLAMQQRFLPASLNWSHPMDNGHKPITELKTDVDLHYVLCNSFGFGGNDSSLLLSSPKSQITNHKLPFTNHHSPIHILAAKQISIQQPLSEDWMQNPITYQVPYVRSIAADYKSYVTPIEARRMGNILKRALATSIEAMRESGIENPDACITGTGLGCIENTELFLDALCRDGEQLLKPTYFMQSTHNTISSLIAIKNKLHGYNATYAHKGISFDSALQDAWLQLCSDSIKSALVGGHDEMTPSYFKLLEKIGYLGQGNSIAGETAVSLVLAQGNAIPSETNPLCELAAFSMRYCPEIHSLHEMLQEVLKQADITLNQIDAVMTGVNGNQANDNPYLLDSKELFANIPLLQYKHLFGESYTASGFAYYVAAHCLDKGVIPQQLYVDASQVSDKTPKNILVFNRSDGKNYSFGILNTSH